MEVTNMEETKFEFMDGKTQFAILIDAENVRARYATVIFDELEKFGYASCRRIYGNWSKGSDWKEMVLLENSIQPIQQFSYTTGKNSTDMAMVIDAMDLLYQNKVDAFCLVTSDSDFTRLAMRLREEGKFVLGMGESKAPVSLTRACNRFIYLNLVNEMEKGSENVNENGPAGKTAERTGSFRNEENTTQQAEEMESNVTSIDDLKRAVLAILNETGKGKMELGEIGSRLGKRYADFDVRNYGYTKLSVFLQKEMPEFEIKQEGHHNYIKKSVQTKLDDIKAEVMQIIRHNGGSVDNLSVINDELKSKIGNFDLNDYGYSRISSFLRGMDELVVEGNTVRLKKQKK